MLGHLYFIAEISKSIRAGASAEDINDLVRRIVNRGKEPQYQKGFKQFVKFVEAGNSEWQEMPGSQKELILRAIKDITQTSKKVISKVSHSLLLCLERNGELLARFDFAVGDQPYTISDLLPGDYELKTDSDWLLWQASLSEYDLLWTHSHPDINLPMAADTNEASEGVFKEVLLLDGELAIRIYPGLETGCMSIEVKKRADK